MALVLVSWFELLIFILKGLESLTQVFKSLWDTDLHLDRQVRRGGGVNDPAGTTSILGGRGVGQGLVCAVRNLNCDLFLMTVILVLSF